MLYRILNKLFNANRSNHSSEWQIDSPVLNGNQELRTTSFVLPDVLMDIQLYDAENGGRRMPTSTGQFACPFQIDDHKHDGRIFLDTAIHPGEFRENMRVKFLDPDTVMPKLFLGKKIFLWEIGFIGEAIVKEITNVPTFHE